MALTNSASQGMYMRLLSRQEGLYFLFGITLGFFRSFITLHHLINTIESIVWYSWAL